MKLAQIGVGIVLCLLFVGGACSTTFASPLVDAALKGETARVVTLIDKGADVEENTETKQTPLMLSALNGHESTVRALLDKGANIEARDQFGRTPLMFSLIGGNVKTIEVLLNSGADVNGKDYYERTPHLLASQTPHFFETKELLESNTKLKVNTLGVSIEQFKNQWKADSIFAKHDWRPPTYSEKKPFHQAIIGRYHALMLSEYKGEAYWASVAATQPHPVFLALMRGEIEKLIIRTNPSLTVQEIEKILTDLRIIGGKNIDLSRRLNFTVVNRMVYSIEILLLDGAPFRFCAYRLQQ
jgi:hypothetical protein